MVAIVCLIDGEETEGLPPLLSSSNLGFLASRRQINRSEASTQGS